MITDWARKFINLFMPIVDTKMEYPKLHNWCYHIVNTIQKYGAINGFTTETYELLHKNYVKIPYRMSNHRNATSQIINMVLYIFLKKIIHIFFININNIKLCLN